MGKHELKNKKDEGKWNWALLAANVLLTLCFAAVFWPILHKGSLSGCAGAPLQGSRCGAQKHSTHKFLWGEKLYEI